MPSKRLVLLSVPAIRRKDVEAMPYLQSLICSGGQAELTPGFPAVTCPVQANMITGTSPSDHGVIANGFFIAPETFPQSADDISRIPFGPVCPACHGGAAAKRNPASSSAPRWPKKNTPPRVEMWTAPNHCLQRSQIWQALAAKKKPLRSAAWFPLHIKEASAEPICTPAPIHHPDGSESLWCYTRPPELYGELRDRLGHFPLKHYWGPLTDVAASRWIVDSALVAMERMPVDFYYIYLPHLDYAPQRHGPDAPEVETARAELDGLLERLVEGTRKIFQEDPTWVIAGEYAMTPTERVVYPNRLLREMGLLQTRKESDGEHLDLEKSKAWALCDHQCAHVYVRDGKSSVIRKIREHFSRVEGIDLVLADREQKEEIGIGHERSGHLVLASTPDSWFAYYWWLDNAHAPAFARTVDIHRKPGYDPVELFWDGEKREVPLDASLVRGSHGAPARDPLQKTVLLASETAFLAPLFEKGTDKASGGVKVDDHQIYDLVLRAFDDSQE